MGSSKDLRTPFTEASARAVDIRRSLFLLTPDRWAAVLMGLSVGLMVVLWLQFDRTVESIALLKHGTPLPGALDWLPSAFDLLLRFGIVTSMVLATWSLYRFFIVWRQFKAFLILIRRMPIISAFDRLPLRISRITRPTLTNSVREQAIDSMVQMQSSHLHRIFEHARQERPPVSARPRLAVAHAMGYVADPMRQTAATTPVQYYGGQFTLLYSALEECWATEPSGPEITRLAKHVGDPGLTDEALKASTTGRFRRMFEGTFGLWVRAAEELAACEVVEYIEWVLRQLRRLALLLLAILVLATSLLSSYPFQPHSMIMVVFFGLVIGTVITIVPALIQMNRDEVLSRITKTAPGVITWNTPFVLNMALFGIVPLMALLSSEFPTVRSILFAWVEPLLRALARG